MTLISETSPRILVVDDDPSSRDLLALRLAKAGYASVLCESAQMALDAMSTEPFAAVVTDICMDGMDGISLCERIALNNPDVPVVVMTAHSSLDSAVAALRAKAFDFLQKPFDAPALVATMEAAMRHRAARQPLEKLPDASATRDSGPDMIGTSAPFIDLIELATRIAPMDTTVMIVGESGTGKELIARRLHEGSRRAKSGSFVAINCAAMPENLLEAELFGHVKGAFTDARSDRIGLFEQARGGTLLLDELGEMPLHLQPKLLRALQERVVRPIGGTKEISTDVRVIAATNADLGALVREGKFREDLYYRINVIELRVPALRDRGNDVLLCAQHFLDTHAQGPDRRVTGLTPEAADRLLSYKWPGNVRELQNTIERAVALARHDKITVDDLPEAIQRYRPRAQELSSDQPTLRSLEEVERAHIERVLQATNGNKTLAAQILGVDRRTLYRKNERYETRTPPRTD
jgi:two-component system response regulator AtoC